MTAAPVYRALEPIGAQHRIDAFDSGKPPLDDWLRRRALDNEGRASRTYVTTDGERVVAYYSLAAGAVMLRDLHRRYRHNLPDPVPVMVLGRLAVDRGHAGRGLGAALLRDAMLRTLEVSRAAGVRMLLVHAIDDEAASFYLRYGFHAFPTGGRTLFLPVETIAAAL